MTSVCFATSCASRVRSIRRWPASLCSSSRMSLYHSETLWETLTWRWRPTSYSSTDTGRTLGDIVTKEVTRISFECTSLGWMTLRSPSELQSGSFRTCHGVPYSAFSGWTFNCTPTSSPGDTDCSPATTRFEFADWFLAQHNLDDDFINNIWWTDESHIYLNGYVNTHNAIHWGSQRPTAVVPIRRFPEKVTVWCAISSHGVFGPYYYDQNGQNVTVNGTRYYDMPRTKFIPDLFNFCLQHDLDPLKMWFQQDGAWPHIVNTVRQWLQVSLGAGPLDSIWTIIGQLDRLIWRSAISFSGDSWKTKSTRKGCFPTEPHWRLLWRMWSGTWTCSTEPERATLFTSACISLSWGVGGTSNRPFKQCFSTLINSVFQHYKNFGEHGWTSSWCSLGNSI